MTEILIERINHKGRNWVRTHATDSEVFSLCSKAIHSEIDTIELGEGKVTCPDCIEIIKKCKGIPNHDLQPEYENDLFWKQ